MTPFLCRVIFRQNTCLGHSVEVSTHRRFSSYTATITLLASAWSSTDPGRLVSGLTKEQVDAHPEIAEFLRQNFENKKDSESSHPSNGISIPKEILEEHGFTEDDLSWSSSKNRKKKRYGDPRIDAGLGNEEQQRLNIRVLRTFLRTEEGTRPCNRLRSNQQLIPGILYGGDAALSINSLQTSSKILLQTPWSELQRELDRFHRRFECRVYDVTVYENEQDNVGTVHRVLPRNVQRHPVQGKIYCANFLRYHAHRPIKIPLDYINREESPALKRDGFIVPVRKHVECFIEEGVPIPEALEVECTGLVVKDVIRMDRVIFPDGVRASDRVDIKNFVVGPVQGGRSAMTEDEAAVEGDSAAKVS